MTTKPNPRFIRSIRANQRYWAMQLRAAKQEELIQFDAERHNLVRAMEMGLVLEETLDSTAEFLEAADQYLQQNGARQTWTVLMMRLTELLPAEHPKRYFVLNRLAQMLFTYDRLNEANEALLEALAVITPPNEAYKQLQVSVALLTVRFALRDFTGTRTYLDRAYDWLKIHNDDYLHAVCLYNEALLQRDRARYKEAVDFLQRALSLEESNPAKDNFVMMQRTLAQCWFHDGQKEKAVDALYEALRVARAARLHHLECNVCHMLGTLYFNSNNFMKALTIFEQINVEWLAAQGLHLQLMVTKNNIGNCKYKLGQLDEAEKLLWDTHRMATERQINNRFEWDSYGTLGHVYLQMQKYDKAAHHYYKAVEEFSKDMWLHNVDAQAARDEFLAGLENIRVLQPKFSRVIKLRQGQVGHERE